MSAVIPLPDAQSVVLQRLSALSPINLAVVDAVGHVAAATVSAPESSPSFANSAMDGFALRARESASGLAHLRIVDTVFAGDERAVRIEVGEAVRVMTGAPLPEGADCVCMNEEVTVESGGNVVVIHRALAVGESVRLIGEHVFLGQTLLSPGDVLTPELLGLLVSQGVSSISVHPRPRVGVLSTGNELHDDAALLARGAIRDANRPTLLASLRQSGFPTLDLGLTRDSPTAIRDALSRGGRECDAVISTGGVSVGDADFVKTVLVDLHGENARVMQVAIRPGKPFAYAYDEATGTPFFALAGNPSAALVGFELFVRPALRLLAGHGDLERPTFRAELDSDLPRRRDGKLHLVRAVSQVGDDGCLHVVHLFGRSPGSFADAAHANCLVVVPDGDGLLRGDHVSVMILDDRQLCVAG